jgi:hypothetical protein
VTFGLSYQAQIWVFRVLVWVLPVIALFVAKRICDELLRGEVVEIRRKAVEAEPLAES